MRIAVVCFGSLGDVLPYVALARRLMARGHDVWLCTADKYEREAQTRGVRFVSCARWSDEHQRELMKAVLAEPNPVRHLDIIYGRNREAIVSVIPAVLDATSGADLIVSHVISIAGYAAAQRHKTPLVTGHLFDGAIPSRRRSPLGNLGPLNRPVWAMVGRTIRRASDPALNAALAAAGLPPERDLFLSSSHSRLLNLVAVSPAVCTLAPIADRPYRLTGSWLLDEEPPSDPALAAFVEAADPPVVIGFGSMMGIDAADWTRRIVDGLAGRRAVLQMGWADLGGVQLPANVYRAGAVSHAWLFPRASAVIHHGGSGTTAAAMRAGVPSSVVWFVGDQPTWGKRIASLGVGTAPVRFSRFSSGWLEETLTRLTSDERIRNRAAALGARLRTEDGAAAAAAAIESHLE